MVTVEVSIPVPESPRRRGAVAVAGSATAGLVGRNSCQYINRELSWLDFNSRVLALAEDENQPLLERAKFLAIFSSNLDEFFSVRVAGLKDQVAAGLAGTAADGLSPSEQLRLIRTEVESQLARRGGTFVESIAPELADEGIVIAGWPTLDEADRAELGKVFEERIFPVLTPLAVDPGHPFPYISNLSLNLAVIVRDPQAGHRRFARVKVPPLLPGFVPMSDRSRFVPLEEVISAHLGALFPGMEIESHAAFRVTRNADLTLAEDEADDLLEAVELELRRQRFGRAVRLEIAEQMSTEVRELLTRELDLEDSDVYEVLGPLDLSGLWAVHGLDRPDLKDEPYVPVTPARLAVAENEPANLFRAIRRSDILLHHPYDSFASTVEAFIAQASRDPKVLAIKQTLYRTSGDSPIVRSLIRAAERGKQVAALVEVKARGDEAANISWARALEEAGVHVVYGLVGLKTHSKTALVVRQESDRIRRYCHVGTGNYNSTTARIYEDLGILTADDDLGADLGDLFNFLTGYSRRTDYRKLIIAPLMLRNRMIELIEGETAKGPDGRIIWKLNNVVDPGIIDALYKASSAGVQVDLIVRGVCCLRPGVPGLSELITVRGLVGRYLEHSRIFYFSSTGPVSPSGGTAANPDDHLTSETDGSRFVPDGGSYYIGSADMMQRNLDHRVEAVVGVTGAELQGRLREILEIELRDDVLAWELDGDGSWHKVPTVEGIDSQRRFQDLATERASHLIDARAEQLPA
jgi:polyphosphate kinase